jgi:hypothetical protein
VLVYQEERITAYSKNVSHIDSAEFVFMVSIEVIFDEVFSRVKVAAAAVAKECRT